MVKGHILTTEHNPVSPARCVCMCVHMKKRDSFHFHEKKSQNVFINVFVKITNIKDIIHASELPTDHL